jgi:hypothetical protein
MKKIFFVTGAALLWVIVSLPVSQLSAQDNTSTDPAPLRVFQAAGPTAASIQSTIDEFRAALGEPVNGNAPGPLDNGRREINWDGGGGVATTAPAPTPFTGFLNTRGALFGTVGTGFVQATPEGMADLFGNLTYDEIFQTFSPLRLFSPVGSNFTEVQFFVPGAGNIPARVTGFGAVFVDVDQPDGRRSDLKAASRASTIVDYFAANGNLLFTSSVPASTGDAGLSFFGIVFDRARIATVRITAGDTAPGPNDTNKTDIVVMDDFIYGEPQEIR